MGRRRHRGRCAGGVGAQPQRTGCGLRPGGPPPPPPPPQRGVDALRRLGRDCGLAAANVPIPEQKLAREVALLNHVVVGDRQQPLCAWGRGARWWCSRERERVLDPGMDQVWARHARAHTEARGGHASPHDTPIRATFFKNSQPSAPAPTCARRGVVWGCGAAGRGSERHALIIDNWPPSALPERS